MRWLTALPRIVLGSALGLGGFLWTGGPSLDAARHFAFVVPMRTSVAGRAQLFTDRGAGFSEADSAVVPVEPTARPVDVRLPVLPGAYRALRFDPNTVAGDYEIGLARIEDGDGRVVATFGTRAFEMAQDLALVERTDMTLRVRATSPSSDPQLLAVFAPPLVVSPTAATLVRLLLMLLVLVAAAIALVSWLDIRLLRSRTRVGSAWPDRPSVVANGVLVVSLAGVASGVVATYPLFLGRSLVSPTTGASVMLYDRPPYAPGALDFTVEDTRGTDTGSLMWGFIGYAKVQRDAMAAGEWPLFLRPSGLGRPLWGQGQAMFLDPLHLLSLLVPDPAHGWDLKFIWARVFFAMGAGLCALAATGSVFAGVMVAAAAPFIGYYTFRLVHPAAFSITYAPWLLGALVMLARQTRWKGLLQWGAATALAGGLQIVASTPKEGVITLLACQLVGVLAIACGAGPLALRVRRLVVYGVAGLVALLLSAPQWLVFADTLSRAWTVYDVPAVRLAAWPHVASWALGAVATGRVWPGANMVLTMGLVFAAAAPVKREDLGVWIGAWVAVLGCGAVALGAVPTPWLLKTPFIGQVYSINTTFPGAALPPMLLASAFGFAGVGRVLSSPTRIGLSTTFTALLIAGIFHWQGGVSALGTAGMAWVVLTLVVAMALPWLMWSWMSEQSTRLAGISLVVVLVALLAPGGLHLDTGIPQIDRELMQPRPYADLDQSSPAIDVGRAASGEPFRAIGLGNVLFPGTQALYGMEGIVGADAIEWPYLRELGTAAGMFHHPWIWLSIFSVEDLHTMRGLLDLFGVRIVFTPPEVAVAGLPELAVHPRDLVRVFERSTAWPRAFFTSNVESYDEPRDLVARLAEQSGPMAAVQSSDTTAMAAVRGYERERKSVTAAHDYLLTPNTTTFVVEATAPGLAVLGEAYEGRDFRATLNGEDVPYIRVDHVYKGVVVPAPGTWTVRFEYRPRFWAVSWALAGAGLLALALAELLAVRLHE